MIMLQPQAAASLHARSNPNLSYPAKVGVNTYIVIHFPFGRKRKHVTRTVARTFSPGFTYSADLLLPIVLPSGVGGKKQLSLAEQLEDSVIVFEVWLVFRFTSLLPEKRLLEKCHFRPLLFKSVIVLSTINHCPGVKCIIHWIALSVF